MEEQFKDWTDEEAKAVLDMARDRLKADKDGVTPEGDAAVLTRKAPTSVAAIDPEQAVERASFGAPAILHEDTKRDIKSFGLGLAIRGIATGNWAGAGLEKDWVRKATLEVDDDSLGGFTVPDFTRLDIMEKLRAKAVFRAAGATILPNSPPVVNLPTQTGNMTGYMVGMGAQAAAITQSDPTFGNKQLVLKRVAARSLIDMALVKHSPVAVESLVRNDVVKTIALKEDQQYWGGTGISGEVSGILYDPNLTNTYSAIGALSLTTHLKAALDTLSARDAGDDITGLLMHPTTYGYCTNKVDGVDRPLMWPDPSAPWKKTLAGYPVYTCTQITNGYILIGNFSEFFIAEGGDLEILVLREKYADQLAYGLVAHMEFDGRARQIAEFELLSGITS